jgi:hypothetical protein
VIEPKYESAGEFRDGRAIVRNGDKYALIDLSGKLIGDIPYRVLGDFHQGLLRVQTPRPTKYGFVDLQGKIAIQPQFMPAGEFPDDSSNLPFGGLDREWVYFDRTGKIIIRISMGEPLTGARPFVNGRLAVKEGFTWGFKDASGKFAIPPKYNDVSDFKDGVARVQEGAKWILIDPRGKEVSPDKRKLRPIEPFSEGLALARENDLARLDRRSRSPRVSAAEVRGSTQILVRARALQARRAVWIPGSLRQNRDFECVLRRVRLRSRPGFRADQGRNSVHRYQGQHGVEIGAPPPAQTQMINRTLVLIAFRARRDAPARDRR